MTDIKERVCAFVASNFYVADPTVLEDGASLLDLGIIDSTSMIEIVFFIEETSNISVEENELLPENFETIERIANFIDGKQESKLPKGASILSAAFASCLSEIVASISMTESSLCIAACGI